MKTKFYWFALLASAALIALPAEVATSRRPRTLPRHRFIRRRPQTSAAADASPRPANASLRRDNASLRRDNASQRWEDACRRTHLDGITSTAARRLARANSHLDTSIAAIT